MSTDKGYENLRPCPGFPYLMADDESTQDPLCTEPHYDGMQPCFMCAGLRQARVEGIQTRGKRQGMSMNMPVVHLGPWPSAAYKAGWEDCQRLAREAVAAYLIGDTDCDFRYFQIIDDIDALQPSGKEDNREA